MVEKYSFFRSPIRALALGIFFLSGCASMHQVGRTQSVLIQSNPSGATILVDGQDAGQTPQFIEIERKRRPVIQLRTTEGEKSLPLATRYRWRDSFFSNFIFLTYAPIGWLVDLATGTAWNAVDSPLVPVTLSSTDRENARLRAESKTSAIAPPQAASLALSDAAAIALENSLRSRLDKNHKLLPFKQTLPTFVANDYDYDYFPRDIDRRDLYYSLKADTIYESTILERDSKLILRSTEKDTISGEAFEPVELTFLPSDEIERAFAFKTWWTRALPNTVGVDFANEKLQVTQGSKTYDLIPSGNEMWWASGLRYLTAIDVSNIPERRSGRSLSFAVALVPSANLSRRQVKATGLPDNGLGTDQEYTRWRIAAGYGPEFGMQVSRHYFYIQLIPEFFWSEITWNQEAKDRSITETGIAVGTEIAYVYHFNSNWNARLFQRVHTEGYNGWAEALGNRLPFSAELISASSTVGGISIGYRFEPRFEGKSWRAPDKIN